MFRCRESNEKQSVTRCCLLAPDSVWSTFAQLVRLPYVMMVKLGCFIGILKAFGKVDCFPSLRLPSGPHHPGHAAGHCEVHHKGTDL